VFDDFLQCVFILNVYYKLFTTLHVCLSCLSLNFVLFASWRNKRIGAYVMWSFRVTLMLMWTPRYLTDVTVSRVIMWSLYFVFTGMVCLVIGRLVVIIQVIFTTKCCVKST